MRFHPTNIRVVRNFIFDFLYNRFSKTFSEKAKKKDKATYEKLAEFAKNTISQEFLSGIEKRFGHLPSKEFVDGLALYTQVVLKRSKLYYGHGYLLYAALCRYTRDNPSFSPFTILETGTARGFSSVMMAKALDDSKCHGKILSIDILPSDVPMYWNCISDFEGKKTRFELLGKWSGLVERYIVFLQGYSDFVFRGLGLSRINFAFVDGSHEYEGVKADTDYIIDRQQVGDVIVFDDYTLDQFPGVVRAVDSLGNGGQYRCEILKGDTSRQYAYCVREKN